MAKHYVAGFTVRRDDGAEQAVCGAFVHDEDHLHVNEQTACWGCRRWLHDLEHPHQVPVDPAGVVARITAETPWGVSVPS